MDNKNNTRNTKNKILAIYAALTAIPVKPKTAAMIATMKKTRDQVSMSTSFPACLGIERMMLPSHLNADFLSLHGT